MIECCIYAFTGKKCNQIWRSRGGSGQEMLGAGRGRSGLVGGLDGVG